MIDSNAALVLTPSARCGWRLAVRCCLLPLDGRLITPCCSNEACIMSRVLSRRTDRVVVQSRSSVAGAPIMIGLQTGSDTTTGLDAGADREESSGWSEECVGGDDTT